MELEDPIYKEDLFKYNNAEERRTFLEGLNTYYRLKHDYEKYLDNEKHKITKSAASKQRRRRLYNAFVPKCINCKQPGGTIFTEKYVSFEDGRVAKAFCGNKTTPCPLDIVINLGNVVSVEHNLEKSKNNLERVKTEIIKNKNNILFGLVNEEKALKEFEDLRVEANEESEYSAGLETLYLDQTDNLKRNEKIEELKKIIIDDIFYIKNYIKDYDKTENLQFIRDVLELYVGNLYFNPRENTADPEKMTVMEKYRKLEWPVNLVEYDNDTEKYHLKQMHYNPKSLEYNSSEKFGVEKLVVGVGELVKKRKINKTIKRVSESKNGKNKTKKATMLVIEEDTEEEDAKSPEYAPVSPPYAPGSPPYAPGSEDNTPISFELK